MGSEVNSAQYGPLAHMRRYGGGAGSCQGCKFHIFQRISTKLGTIITTYVYDTVCEFGTHT